MAALRRALPLSGRSIHIKMHPPPRTLAERQEVLRIIERFGPTEAFFSLAYDSSRVQNAFWSIMKDEASTQKLLDASPIRYNVSTDAAPQVQKQGEDFETVHVEGLPEEEHEQKAQKKTYELRINLSDYDHAAAVRKTPLYGPFTPVSPNRSAIAADLVQRIPYGIAQKGLCDWVSDAISIKKSERLVYGETEVSWRVLDLQKKQRLAAGEAMLRGIKGI